MQSMQSTILLILSIFGVTGGGGNHLLDYVTTDSYWQTKQVVVSFDTMAAELKPVPPADDLSTSIAGLGSDDPDIRSASSKKILAIGIPALA
jgi:hypothetical protein